MSFVSTLGAHGKRTSVTIAWPEGAPDTRIAPLHPRDQAGFGMAAGVRVLTGRGLVPAAELAPGDRLPDGRGGTVTLAAAVRVPTDLGGARVAIRAGALGGGLPRADLVVGPRTRLRLRSDVAARLVGRDEVLVAAERLIGLDGIAAAPRIFSDAVHLLFDEYATVVVEDVVLEACLPCPTFMESLPHRSAAIAFAALPKLRYAGAFAAYANDLPDLDAREARQIFASARFGSDAGTLAPETAEPAEPCLVSDLPVGRRRSSLAAVPFDGARLIV